MRQRRRIVRVDRERPVEQLAGLCHQLQVTRVQALASQQVVVIGLDVRLRNAGDVVLAGQFCLQRLTDQGCKVVLNCKHIGKVPIIGLRKQVESIAGLDQLGRNTNPVPRFAHRAFENMGHIQGLTDLAQIGILTLEGERRGSTGDLEPGHLGQHVEDFFRQPFDKERLVTLGRQVVEREHGNRLFAS